MICRACREAAEIIFSPLPPDPDRAIELHEMYCCQDGENGCDCQHDTTSSALKGNFDG